MVDIARVGKYNNSRNTSRGKSGWEWTTAIYVISVVGDRRSIFTRTTNVMTTFIIFYSGSKYVSQTVEVQKERICFHP